MHIPKAVEVLKSIKAELPKAAQWGDINYADLKPRQQALSLTITVLERLEDREGIEKIIKSNVSFLAEPVGIPNLNVTKLADALISGLTEGK